MAMNEARHKVSQLESAIKRVDSVKKHLNRNAMGIKAEIHTSVSRHLECLRGREVSLLSQVDQVLGVKEETLQQQQARLNQALGVLQTGLSMVQDDTASEKQLADTLEKLNHIELSPEETPYISFRADNVNLRESILNYGRVDANGLPLISAFDDPDNPSASLPRHVEEYEDVDHHVFYKTVEEVKRAKTEGTSIQVTIPKLSNRVEDWLQKKTPNPSPRPVAGDSPARHLPAIRPNTLSRSGDTPTLGLSRTSTPDSSCSLNNWLSQIKQQSDLEEEHDFEIIDNSLSQKVAFKSSAKADWKPELEDSKFSKDFFHHIKKDMKTWLHSKSVPPEKFTSDVFRHIPTDAKLWLLQAYQQFTSLDDLQHGDFFQHISKEPSTWLRSRAHGKQHGSGVEGKDFFSHIRKDKDFWLMKEGNGAVGKSQSETCMETDQRVAVSVSSGCAKGCTKDDDKWLMRQSSAQAVQLEDLCRANELCCDISECVSQPDCATLCSLQQAADGNSSGQIFKPLSLPLQDWLAPATGTLEDAKEGTDFFQHIPDGRQLSLWLMTPASSPQSVPAPSKFKDSKEETNQWLKKSTVSSGSSPGSNRPPSALADFCISDWLLVSDDDKEKTCDENDTEKEESEGWSICSDSHNISTDQYVKDVAIATDYFNKWLL